MKQETYTVVSNRELEALVEEHLDGAHLDFVNEMDGCGNNTQHVFALADPEFEVAEHERIEGLMSGVDGYHSNLLPNYFVAQLICKGVLPREHPVLVTVSW